MLRVTVQASRMDFGRGLEYPWFGGDFSEGGEIGRQKRNGLDR